MARVVLALVFVAVLGFAALRIGAMWTVHQATYPPPQSIPTGPTISIPPITAPPTVSIPTYGH